MAMIYCVYLSQPLLTTAGRAPSENGVRSWTVTQHYFFCRETQWIPCPTKVELHNIISYPLSFHHQEANNTGGFLDWSLNTNAVRYSHVRSLIAKLPSQHHLASQAAPGDANILLCALPAYITCTSLMQLHHKLHKYFTVYSILLGFLRCIFFSNMAWLFQQHLLFSSDLLGKRDTTLHRFPPPANLRPKS